MKLEKAKRVVLVRSKCAPAKAEKAAVPLSTETKPLLIHHYPDMERLLASHNHQLFINANSPVSGRIDGNKPLQPVCPRL